MDFCKIKSNVADRMSFLTCHSNSISNLGRQGSQIFLLPTSVDPRPPESRSRSSQKDLVGFLFFKTTSSAFAVSLFSSSRSSVFPRPLLFVTSKRGKGKFYSFSNPDLITSPTMGNGLWDSRAFFLSFFPRISGLERMREEKKPKIN